MRKVAHRVLSAAPSLCAILYGLGAVANPEGAKADFVQVSALMSDARFFWLCVAAAAAYFCLWWVTSIESRTIRQKVQAGLRPHHAALNHAQRHLISQETDADFEAAVERLERIAVACGQWISLNMTESAISKFNYPKIKSASYSWPGEHRPEMKSIRDNVLLQNMARIEVLEQFLQYDAWDGEPASPWERFKGKYKHWKRA